MSFRDFWKDMVNTGSFTEAVFCRAVGVSPEMYSFYSWMPADSSKPKHTGGHILSNTDSEIGIRQAGLPEQYANLARQGIRDAHLQRLANQQWRHEQYAAGMSRNAGENSSYPGGPAGSGNPYNQNQYAPPGYRQVPQAGSWPF